MPPALHRFFAQPCRRYMAHQVVFLVLALNFIIPALAYAFFPGHAVDDYLRINALLGGGAYSHREDDSHLWRYLAAANVMTLGFMCILLMVDLRRFFPVLVPLVFMKGWAAASWLLGWAHEPSTPVFLAAAVLDGVTCGAFVFFATRAHREITDVDDAVLVPRPLGRRGALARV